MYAFSQHSAESVRCGGELPAAEFLSYMHISVDEYRLSEYEYIAVTQAFYQITVGYLAVDYTVTQCVTTS